jgi:capsular polysaccharide biosynthesis protein
MKSRPGDFRVSQRVYEQLLAAYPPSHRAQYGAAMRQLFRDQCRDAWKDAGGWGLSLLWLRTVPDLASTSLIERLAALKERRARKTMTDKIADLGRFRAAPLSMFFRVFILVFLLVLAVSVVITFLLPQTYASTARIKVEPDTESARENPPVYDPYFVQTTFEIINSELVLDPVVRNLKLDEAWGKKYGGGRKLTVSEAVELLKRRLQLAPVRNTSLIAITVFSEDPGEAAQLANGVADAYRDYRVGASQELAAHAVRAIQQQYGEQENRVQEAQSELDALAQPLKSGSNPAGGDSPSARAYQAKQRDLDTLLSLHQALLTKLESVKLEAEMPKMTLVQIVDRAEPGRAPVRPNKPVTILIGALMGICLATAAGAIGALVSTLSSRRLQKAGAAVA